MGAFEQSIAKQSYKSGAPLPDRIANAPELQKHLQIFITGFFDLDSERPAFKFIKQIPFLKIVEYCQGYLRLSEEQTEDFIFHIKRLDAFFINKMKAKTKVSSENGKPFRLGNATRKGSFKA